MGAFAEVMDQKPTLSTNGFGFPLYGQRTLAEQRDQFQVFCGKLGQSAVRVIEVHPVAARQHPADQDTGQGSYGFRHVIETAMGQYVSNGELIAAVFDGRLPHEQG